MPTLRPETPADAPAVRQLLIEAFEQPAEADLVEALRATTSPYLALVAEVDQQIVGHLVFTPVRLEPTAPHLHLVGLAPMAVLPSYQRRGIGAALIEAGLAACRAQQVDAVVVLGHPDYYPRFGFVPSVRFGLRSTYDVPPEVFMAQELVPGALANVSGVVQYAQAFREVS